MASVSAIPPSTDADLRNFVLEGALGSVTTTVTMGVYLTGFALILGASDAMIGLIAAVPSLANVLQLLGSYLLIRSGSARRLCLASLLAHRFSWLLIALIPLLGIGGLPPATLLIVGIALASVFASFTNVSWLAWISRVVPRHIRGRFFARRNVVAGVVAMVTGVVAGQYLDRWQAVRPDLAPQGYTLMYGVALVFGFLCWIVIRRIGEAEPLEHRSEGFLRELRVPLRDRNFRRLLIFMVSWGFSVRLAAPFFDVYMIRNLAIPFSTIALFGIVGGVWNILGMRFWGPMSDIRGNKPVLFAGCTLAALTPLLWLFTSPGSYRILWVANILTPLAWASIGLVTSTLLIKMAPPEVASIYFGLFAALVGVAEAIAPGLGGLAAEYFRTVEVSLFGASFGDLQLLFLLTTLLRVASLPLLLGVRVPDEMEMTNPLRSLRQLREAGGRRRLAAYSIGSMESLAAAISSGTNVTEMRLERALERGQNMVHGIVLGYRRIDRHVEDGIEGFEHRLEWTFGRIIVKIQDLIAWLREDDTS